MQLWVRVVARGAGTFDPWKKHDKFFRLREGDNDGLLSFLNSVGFLDAPFPELENSRSWTGRLPDGNIYTANYAPWTEVREVWAMRRLMQNSLKKLRSFSGKHSDFTVRILTVRGKVKAVITTTTFLQALELTLSVDRLRGSRVQKCAALIAA